MVKKGKMSCCLFLICVVGGMIVMGIVVVVVGVMMFQCFVDVDLVDVVVCIGIIDSDLNDYVNYGFSYIGVIDSDGGFCVDFFGYGCGNIGFIDSDGGVCVDLAGCGCGLVQSYSNLGWLV